jgi:hypothetical protein
MKRSVRRMRRPAWRAAGILATGAALVASVVSIGASAVGQPQVTTVAQSTDPQCTTGYQPQTGFRLDVCIALDGSVVTPSVNVTDAGSTSTSCSIVLEIWDDANNRLDGDAAASRLPCKTGQATGAALDISGLHGVTARTSPGDSLTVHAFARLYLDGKGTYIAGQGDSPTVTVSATATSSSGAGNSGQVSSPHDSPASMTGPAGERDIATMTAQPVDSFFNNIKVTVDQTTAIVCYSGVLAAVIPCTASPEAFLQAINAAATEARVDPRLLLAIMVNERGVHFQAVAHSTPLEFARWLLSLTGVDHSLGMTNMSSDAFHDAQQAAGPNSDLAQHAWTDLVANPILAINASAWLLHGIEDQLPPSWPARYKRDELLTIGYNGGGSVMTGVASGLTPDQADPKNPGKVAWYVNEIDGNWDSIDQMYCHSGTFTCSG